MEMEIEAYDSHGPEVKSNVASISFVDPKNPENTYCVGFKFKGGDLKNPKNWTYHHCNYWTPQLLENDQISKNRVERKKVEKALKLTGGNLNNLLKEYLNKLL